MITERKWLAVTPQTILSNGSVDGLLIVPDTRLFKVKQKVKLFSDAVSPIFFEVKRVISETQMYLGLSSDPIYKYTSLSAFLTADNAKISADEQERPSIVPDAYNRAMYEEEPVVAQRSVLVDGIGRKYDKGNPIPVDIAQVDIGDISIGTDGFDPTDPDSMLATGSEDGTKTGTKRALRVDSDGSAFTKTLNALIHKKYDTVQITAKSVNGPTTVVYRDGGLSGTIVAVGTLAYDIDGDFASMTVAQ